MSFPVASRILAFKWQDEQFRKHRYQIRNALPTVNVKPPKFYPHIHLKVNKIAIEEEKQARFEKENQILLHNLRNIVKGHGMLDNWNRYKKKPDLHAGARLKQQREIEWQNQQMLKRIKGTKPVIQKKKMDKDYKKSRIHKNLHDTTCKSYPPIRQKEVDDGVDLDRYLKESSNKPESQANKQSTEVRSNSPRPADGTAVTREQTQTPEAANEKTPTPKASNERENTSDSLIDDKLADYAADYESESESVDNPQPAEEKREDAEPTVKKTKKKKIKTSVTQSNEADENDHDKNRTAAVPKLPKI